MKLDCERPHFGYTDLTHLSAPEVCFQHAQAFLFQKNLDMAIRFFFEACNLSPHNPHY